MVARWPKRGAGSSFRTRSTIGASAMLLLASAALLPGCVGPEVALSAGLNAVSAQTATFTRGELISATRASLAQTHAAVGRALSTLGFKTTRTRLRDTSASTWAVTLDDRDIRVTLSAASPAVTSIAIKAGFWGDLALSRLVQEQIDTELRTAAVPAER